ncbi:SDR family NAD(P)-dependent oxidoreductase [Pedobacter arcticus]|uniref:SDR family NAD(P)-dependent oxidoreductase n=1 Tax=Pedobacter arcticus TaxID=752140 RepID=UPI0002F33455|nr:SDR family oxidoreductase [Pedobacter arcticus]
MKLKGKRALVTGSSRGIGKEIALQLAKEGVIVALHYSNNKIEAEKVLLEIKELGVEAFLFQADFNDPQEAIKLGNDVWDSLGSIDYLINNAGVSYKTHFLDATIKDIDFFTNINFKSTLLLTQTITRKMVETSTEGSVYSVTSINGIQPGIGLNIYGATKGALETLMKGVALELAPHNIKVNTIAAGAIQTSMNAPVWKDDNKLRLVNDNIPLGRLGQAQEVASVIVSLLSSGTYMTGATIVVDGGWMLNQGYINPQTYNFS